MLRAPDFQSTKTGVASKSWHKTGRAFDYDQSSPLLVVVREDKGSQTFFRTYLRATDGLGILTTKKDIRGNTVKGNLFDFTAAAERFGFSRIPAWRGWAVKGKGYNLMEFWHYEIRDGLTWDQAMSRTYSPEPKMRPVLKRGSSGPAVGDLQRLLKIPDDENFGPKTEAAIIAAQKRFSLSPSGVVDDTTWTVLTRT